ncbi:MAG: F0F1 ATP synthase subunit alpha [Candidatus Woesebacteria bacterium]|nr:MAG: F0F1 ATP synthase subunit alpha [Candidatus Woesebacteria bacterium]
MIHSYKYCQEKIKDIGYVVRVKDALVSVKGMTGGVVGEAVAFEDGRHGMIQTLEPVETQIVVFSREPVAVGTKVARTDSALKISVGDAMLGHTVTALGYDADDFKELSSDSEPRPVEVPALGISFRRKIDRFLETGVAVCDLITPLGQGQRELIIGDRKSGKTHFLLQVILSAVNKKQVVVYAFIGKKRVEIERVEQFLKEHGVRDKCIIVSAPASSPAGEIYLAPFTAMTIAEYYRDKGIDSVVILDDLSTHAKYYREISLLGGKFPGRESYPGDIFYIHARLLERAGNFNINGRSASITALPVAETLGGDFTGYIQTNLASITDGHLFFDSELFLKGIRPAINFFLSVTRVGRQTQTPLLRNIGFEVLSFLKKHADYQRYLRFGAEINENLRKTVNDGDKIYSFFNQTGYDVYPSEISAYLVALIVAGKWNGKAVIVNGKSDGKSAIEMAKKLALDKSVGEKINKSKTLQELVEKIKK